MAAPTPTPAPTSTLPSTSTSQSIAINAIAQNENTVSEKISLKCPQNVAIPFVNVHDFRQFSSLMVKNRGNYLKNCRPKCKSFWVESFMT